MKKIALLFLLLSLALCLVPSVGMLYRPTEVTTENRPLTGFPSLVDKDGAVNTGFFDGFDQYFNEHFAFRNELVFTDAWIQGKLFATSSSSRVIYGRDGWLFYASTLDDYLGLSRLSERQLYNLTRNLSLSERFARERGARFVLAVPPNKNTLYGENMPYYDRLIVDPAHNVDLLSPRLAERGIGYADLPALFRGEDEVLYLKRDSHWNKKGALLACNALMDALSLEHDTYADVPVRRAIDNDGDLNRMLYSFYGKKTADYHYEIPRQYRVVSDSEAPDASWIETEGGAGDHSLLMFRDSFGETLYPLLANQFQRACFSREFPYGLEQRMELCRPDAVIFEIVERNLPQLLDRPPIFSGPEATLAGTPQPCASDTDVSLAVLEDDPDYYVIRGQADPRYIHDHTDILLQVNGVCYEAFHTGENGFLLYLKRERLAALPAQIRVVVRDGDSLLSLCDRTLERGETA